MKYIVIADERTGARPIGDAEILNAVFDGDHPEYLTLDNGHRITCDERPNYHTPEGYEYAEVQELEQTASGLEGVVIGYTRIVNSSN